MKPKKIIMSILALISIILLSLLFSTTSYAKENNRSQIETTYSAYWHKAKNTLGTRAPGRNIRKWGVLEGKTARKATLTELKESTVRLQNMTTPQVNYTSQVSSSPGAYTTNSTGQYSTSELSSIAQCESGGNPSAVSSNGQYRGLYQFDQNTWQNYGGSGDPAAASIEEQTRIAQKLPRSSWPNC